MYIMANVSIGVPTALNAVVVAEINYGVKLGYGFNALLILATQLTGFSLAGLCRRYLVWPASMVWPQNLIVCTLLNTLHAEEEDARGGVSRFRFFCYAAVGAFFWAFLPGEWDALVGDVVLTPDDRLPLHRIVHIFVCLLDQAPRHRRQPVVWCIRGSRHECSYFRLGADHLARQSAHGTMVG